MHAERNITCRSIVEKFQIWGSPAWILEIECFVSVWERVSYFASQVRKRDTFVFSNPKTDKVQNIWNRIMTFLLILCLLLPKLFKKIIISQTFERDKFCEVFILW